MTFCYHGAGTLKSPICLSSLMKYGWEFSNGLLVLIVTDDLPALLAFVEKGSCGLKKKCVSNRCMSFKNSLFCTDLCKCTSRKNDGKKQKKILKH